MPFLPLLQLMPYFSSLGTSITYYDKPFLVTLKHPIRFRCLSTIYHPLMHIPMIPYHTAL